MKKTLIPLFLSLIILAIILCLWWQTAIAPVNESSQEVEIVVIPKGWGIDQIALALKEKGLIKNIPAFKLMIIKKGLKTKLQAGDFRLSPSMALEEICQTLTHGTLDVWVTIPEGLRKEEIAKKINQAFHEYQAQFEADEFLQQTDDLEGYLFPDTYLIPKDASVSAIVSILTDTFEQKYLSLKPKSELSKKQIIILASLLEREAKKNKDKELIAGILLKRLNQDWPLQIDASLQYLKANLQFASSNSKFDQLNWWPKVTPEDLQQLESPYNTYLNKGLPPAPICNPGLNSLRAALNPQESEYWFYISDKKGQIHFAETLQKQEENIEKFLTSD